MPFFVILLLSALVELSWGGTLFFFSVLSAKKGMWVSRYTVACFYSSKWTWRFERGWTWLSLPQERLALRHSAARVVFVLVVYRFSFTYLAIEVITLLYSSISIRPPTRFSPHMTRIDKFRWIFMVIDVAAFVLVRHNHMQTLQTTR